jgi:hypothetical protein
MREALMNKIIYLIGVMLSALSTKPMAGTHVHPDLSQPNNKIASNVYCLRTPEYLKNESN